MCSLYDATWIGVCNVCRTLTQMAWKRVSIDHLFDKLFEWGGQYLDSVRRRKPKDMPPQDMPPQAPIVVHQASPNDECIAFKKIIPTYFGTTLIAEQYLFAPRRRPRVILAVTGCVAAANVGVFFQSLDEWSEVRVVVSTDATQYISPESTFPVLNAEDPMVLNELQRWADMLIVAPLSITKLRNVRKFKLVMTSFFITFFLYKC